MRDSVIFALKRPSKINDCLAIIGHVIIITYFPLVFSFDYLYHSVITFLDGHMESLSTMREKTRPPRRLKQKPHSSALKEMGLHLTRAIQTPYGLKVDDDWGRISGGIIPNCKILSRPTLVDDDDEKSPLEYQEEAILKYAGDHNLMATPGMEKKGDFK